MKAACWMGKHDVRVLDVPDPKLINPRDAIIKITSTAICGSDLHLYNGFMPGMMTGDILGHEFMGEVVELGSAVKNLQLGDRVIVPFTIACGSCFFCKKQLTSLCDNSNPNPTVNEKLNGYSGSGLFGYTHIYGGYAGGQAEYVRVPFADVGPLKIPDELRDEQVLFLTDIFPTGWQAVEQCGLEGGETVAIWGCGPVGQFAVRSAFLQGAEKVIAIDHEPDRLKMAAEAGAITINYAEHDDLKVLPQLTGGRGPDACIDCVGMEAHGWGPGNLVDLAEQTLKLTLDRCNALRHAIVACRKGGVVSVPGVYAGLLNHFPFGAAFAKSLTFKMGQTHVHRHLGKLLEVIQNGSLDPSFVISEELPLTRAPEAYRRFQQHETGCIKFVLKPEFVDSEVVPLEHRQEIFAS